MRPTDFIRAVAGAGLVRFDDCMSWLNLAGKFHGPEYLPTNPKRGDHKPGSFSINHKTGSWSDFATGDKGGDLVALAAYLLDIRQGEAASRMNKALGLGIDEPEKRPRKGEAGAAHREAPPQTAAPRPADPGQDAGALQCVMPVPDDAPAPPAGHSRHGKPARRYVYAAADGRVNFYHDRYEPKREGERKQFAPLTLWRDAAGAYRWQFKAPPEPRPLYGLPELASHPEGAAWLVEGEKAAEALVGLLPGVPALSWQGGALAVGKADLSPLAGRACVVFPDHDEAGAKAADGLVKRIHQMGAASLQVVNLAALALSPGWEGEGEARRAVLIDGPALAGGDDAADLVARGWTADHFALFLARPDALVAIAAPSKSTSPAPAVHTSAQEPAPALPLRRFVLDDKGVWYYEPDKSPRWICAPLDVVAMVRDPHNHGWALLVAFHDPDGNRHRVVIPMAMFKGDGAEVAGLLLDQGLNLAPRARALLVEYLQTADTPRRARITGRTGWHDSGVAGGVFVLPELAIGGGEEEWLFETETPAANTYTRRGTLNGWRENVAALCVGNSRLVFAVSMAFASPLLYLIGGESGGFHLRSASSDGKTTALRVAASVCGGADYMQRWRATDNGLEGLAMLHCDAPLLLDELAQIDPRAAGEVAYMLANGSGKTRAGRTGAARERSSWRLLFLSAGEIGLAEHMGEAGKSPKAGQELRLAEIPADAGAGLGVFEQLHEYGGGSEFAKALAEAIRQHHGTAFPAWLERLAKEQADTPDNIKKGIRAFEKLNLTEKAGGQARRVAHRFALVGAAGELATYWGITGWPQGEAMKSAASCFLAWLARRGGESNHEERAMLAQVREFLRRYGESAFTDWERPGNDSEKHAPRSADRVGYRRYDEAHDETHYYIFAETWKSRLCKGFDHAAVGRLLLSRGCIESGTEKDRPWLVRLEIPTEGRARVVHVFPALFSGE